MESTKVLLCDDGESYRLLLRTGLSAEDDLEVVAEAETGVEAIALAGELHPDVIVLDLVMPELDGFAAMPELLQASPDSKVVVISNLDAGTNGDRVIELGASAFIDKDSSMDEITDTIRRYGHGDA